MSTPTAQDLVAGCTALLNLVCAFAQTPSPDDRIATLTTANAQLTTDLGAAHDIIAQQSTKIAALNADVQTIKQANSAEDVAIAKAEDDGK